MTRRRALAYNPPSAGERIFVADQQGGISYSDDNGETWTRVTVSDAPTRLFGLARNANTGTICASGYGYYRIMRSVDNGESYKALYYIASRRQLSALMVDGEDKWFLCGDDYDDVDTSSDDGATWSKTIDLGTDGQNDKYASGYADGLYIISAIAQYWTSTNGTSFTKRTDIALNARAIKKLNGNWVVARGQGIAYSTTGIGDWTAVSLTEMRDIAFDGTYYYAAGKSADYGTLGKSGVWRSSDLINWTEVSTGMTLDGWTVYGIQATASGRLIIAQAKDGSDSTKGRIYTSDDNGASWDLRVNSASYGYTRLCC